MALLWAAGIIWLAIDVAGPPADKLNTAEADRLTDVTGAPITPQDEKRVAELLKKL